MSLIEEIINDFEKDQGNNWILPGKSKSFPGNRPGNSRNN